MKGPGPNRILSKEKLDAFFRKFFGLRIVKTALATSLSLVVAKLIDANMPMMIGLSAIVTMKSSVFDSISKSVNRMISTIMGVIIAVVLQTLGFSGFIPVFLGVIIIINICNKMKWKDAITLALMVFIIVMTHSPGPPDYYTPLQYGLNRIIDTGLGLVVGVLVNILVLPPNRSEFIVRSYQSCLKEAEYALLESLSGQAVDLENFIRKINSLNLELESIKHDGPFSKKKDFKISDLSQINSEFYALLGFISHITESEVVPCIDDKNMRALNEYFGGQMTFPVREFCPIDQKEAFNFYLEESIINLEELRAHIEKISKKISPED